MDTRVFFSDAPVFGRLLGERDDVEHVFLVEEQLPILHVRDYVEGPDLLIVTGGGVLLVQLFDRPELLWIVQAIRLSGETVMQFTPLEPLETADGTPTPGIAAVHPDAVERAQLQASFDRPSARRRDEGES